MFSRLCRNLSKTCTLPTYMSNIIIAIAVLWPGGFGSLVLKVQSGLSFSRACVGRASPYLATIEHSDTRPVTLSMAEVQVPIGISETGEWATVTPSADLSPSRLINVLSVIGEGHPRVRKEVAVLPVEVWLAGVDELRLGDRVGCLEVLAVGNVTIIVGFELVVGAAIGNASADVDDFAAESCIEAWGCTGQQGQGQKEVRGQHFRNNSTAGSLRADFVVAVSNARTAASTAIIYHSLRDVCARLVIRLILGDISRSKTDDEAISAM